MSLGYSLTRIILFIVLSVLALLSADVYSSTMSVEQVMNIGGTGLVDVIHAPVVHEYAVLYYYDGRGYWLNSSYINFALIGLRVDNVSDEGDYTVYGEVVNGDNTILSGYVNLTLTTSTTYIGGYSPLVLQADPVRVVIYAKKING